MTSLRQILFTSLPILLTACAVSPRFRGATAVPTTAQGPANEAKDGTAPRTYLRATGGLSLLPDTNLVSNDAGALQQADASFDPGYAYTFGVGYRVADAWSIEGELGYRTNPIDQVRNTGAPINDGEFASLGFFANAIYHIPVSGRLQPYVGLGAGWIEEIDIDLGSGASVDYSDSAFALQALAGLEYGISKNWSAQLEGRYLQAFGQDLAAESGSGITYDADYQPFSLSLGLKWSF